MTLLREYALVTLGVVSYALGWTIFLLPNNLIGGGVSGEGQSLIDALLPRIKAGDENKTELKIAKLGNDAGIIGAAAL